MVIKVYGVASYSGTQVVTITLHELGLPYELIHVDMPTGAHKKEDYLENMHPFGQTPVLVCSFSIS